MTAYLLDTDVISHIVKKRGARYERIKIKLENVLRKNAVILISPVVYYELARLLYKRNAEKQLAFLNNFVSATN